MIKFRLQEFDENGSSNDFVNAFIGVGRNLRYLYPNLELLPKEDIRAILIGVIFRVVDDMEFYLDRNMSRFKVRDLSQRLGTALEFALREFNAFELGYVEEIASKIIEDKINMYSSNFSLFILALEPYMDKYMPDKNLIAKYTKEAYRKI